MYQPTVQSRVTRNETVDVHHPLSPLDSEMSAFVLRSAACFPVCFEHTGSISCHLSMTPFDNVSLLDETCPLDLTAASLFFPQSLTIFFVCVLYHILLEDKKKKKVRFLYR